MLPKMKPILADNPFLVGEVKGKLVRFQDYGFDSECEGPTLSDVDMVNVHHPDTRVVGVSYAFPDGTAYYIPGQTTVLPDTRDSVWVHNLKHELHVGAAKSGRCSLVGAWLTGFCDDKGRFGLKGLLRDRFGISTASYDDIAKGRKASEIPPEEMFEYACLDAWGALAVGLEVEKRVAALDLLGAWKVEQEFLHVLARMERSGVLLNVGGVGDIKRALSASLQALRDEWDLHFPNVSIDSPAQLADHFYGNGLWPNVGKRGKSGRLSTNREAIQAHIAKLPPGSPGRVAAEIKAEYQVYSKLATTYTDGLLEKAAEHPDGRLRPQALQHGTATGRISMSHPNLQQIPTRSELGKAIKHCLIPAPGNVFVCADYSQIELRVLAHYAGKGRLLSAFQQDLDIHAQTAELVGIPRDRAKTLNFAYVYGAGPNKLAQTIGCSAADAKRFMREYDRAYPEVPALRRRVLDAAYSRGYVRTMLRRRRDLPGLKSGDKSEAWSAERQAFNTIIQGSAADIMKLAAISADAAGLRIVCQVHDEILVECAGVDSDKVMRTLKASMEGAGKLACPLKVEVRCGATWGDCK